MNIKTVSLVLGSGGARGIAHIGVIRTLEKHGFEIKSISGCSIGSLIGGFYAAGKLEEYEQWVRALDRTSVVRLLDFSFDRRGLFKGEKIIGVLRKLIGDHNIEDLKLKYTAVATDIKREKEIWFQEGSLFDAVRASIAAPSVFTPHFYNEMKLVDGGLLNPVPVTPTAGDDTDITIAVNLNAKERIVKLNHTTDDELNKPSSAFRKRVSRFINRLTPDSSNEDHDEQMNILDLLNRSIDIMQNSIAHSKLAIYRPEILIEVPRSSASFFDYHKADELIAIGEELAEEALKDYLVTQ